MTVNHRGSFFLEVKFVPRRPYGSWALNVLLDVQAVRRCMGSSSSGSKGSKSSANALTTHALTPATTMEVCYRWRRCMTGRECSHYQHMMPPCHSLPRTSCCFIDRQILGRDVHMFSKKHCGQHLSLLYSICTSQSALFPRTFGPLAVSIAFQATCPFKSKHAVPVYHSGFCASQLTTLDVLPRHVDSTVPQL